MGCRGEQHQVLSRPIGDIMQQKMALFAQTGAINRFNTELFDVPSWLQVMLGQGLYPAAHHPMVNAVPAENLARYIATNARDAAAEGCLPVHLPSVTRRILPGWSAGIRDIAVSSASAKFEAAVPTSAAKPANFPA